MFDRRPQIGMPHDVGSVRAGNLGYVGYYQAPAVGVKWVRHDSGKVKVFETEETAKAAAHAGLIKALNSRPAIVVTKEVLLEPRQRRARRGL